MLYNSKHEEISQDYLMNCFRGYIDKLKKNKSPAIKTGCTFDRVLRIHKVPNKSPYSECNISADIYINSDRKSFV